jgi:LuxR family maltose regulon positive regulatory protein
MPDALLATKVSLPILRHVFVPREKILRQLSEGVQDGHLLTLVSALVGYGKTTTVRMWVEEAGHPVVWVSLDTSDNDLKQFLTYVLTALELAGDTLGQAALEVIENSRKMNLQHIVRLLVHDLYDLDQPINLALDNVRLLTAKRKHKCRPQMNPNKVH